MFVENMMESDGRTIDRASTFTKTSYIDCWKATGGPFQGGLHIYHVRKHMLDSPSSSRNQKRMMGI